ncbi:MarR family transcriptional regulator [Cohnella caldifontis]|uniref:MarR family winged helix-turn-helix transcriptional regulator n=1 Tax=Cohnella caldifontis TaxID=3027471 RepID=UPI0030DCE4D2
MDTAAEFVKIWMRLTKEWNASLEEELAPQLTAGQLEVLELLLSKEPMKPSDLLPYLETTPAAITTLLDRMERAGLVERKRDEHDRRIVWIRMTELGRSEADRGLRVRAEVANRSLERISAHNRQLLVYLIGKVAGSKDKAQAGSDPPQNAAGSPQSRESGESAQPAESARENQELGV